MKAHCIFCGKNFRSMDVFENHLKNHKELNTLDRNSYLKETKRDIQEYVEAGKGRREARLLRKYMKKKKENKRKTTSKNYYDSTISSIRAILIASGNKR
jgi:hypothetical protein